MYAGQVPQFDAMLEHDEQIEWIGQPSRGFYLLQGVPFFILGLFWGALDYFGFIRHMLSAPAPMQLFMLFFFAIHLAPCYLGILNMLRLLIVVNAVRYAITNKRVMFREGFWGTSLKIIGLDEKPEIEVSVNPLENLGSLGSIRFFTGRTTSRGMRLYDTIRAIPQPYEVYKLLQQRYEDAQAPAQRLGTASADTTSTIW